MRAESGAKAAGAADIFCDDDAGRLIKSKTAVFFGNGRTEQAKVAAFLHKLAGDLPSVVLEGGQLRPDLIVDELPGRLADHPLFVREILGGENVGGFCDQKLAALHIFLFHLCIHIDSRKLLRVLSDRQ